MTDDHSGLTKRYTISIDPEKVEMVVRMIKERLGSPDPDVALDEDDLFRQFLTEVLNAELFPGEVLKYLELTWRGYRRDPIGYPLKVRFIVRDDGGDVMCGQNVIGELRVTSLDLRRFDPDVQLIEVAAFEEDDDPDIRG